MTPILQRLAEAERKLGNIVRYVVVAEVDYDAALARATYGSNREGDNALTAWLPWLSPGGQSLEPGSRALLLAPAGRMETGCLLPDLTYRDARPFGKPGGSLVAANDAVIVERGRSIVMLSDAGVVVVAPQVTISGFVVVDGDLTVRGELKVLGKLQQGGRDVGAAHTHPGVEPGAGTTGPVS